MDPTLPEVAWRGVVHERVELEPWTSGARPHGAPSLGAPGPDAAFVTAPQRAPCVPLLLRQSRDLAGCGGCESMGASLLTFDAAWKAVHNSNGASM